MSATQFVGIDVSKAVLDVAVRPGGETWQVANDEPGIDEVVERLRRRICSSCSAMILFVSLRQGTSVSR